ncbi:Probable pectate lyase 3 [Striga hermonthica]|uniref:Pectate lyase n=1 Tax=Striga hermonthica TaxID=68872 RepID=A0A9N7NQ70_STRHE|nr:Probable pectate lyase 3 [Striga hermonthica]
MPVLSCNNRIVSILLLLSVLSFASFVPKSRAAIAEYDEYLLKKAEESYKESLKAFDPHPEKVADELSKQVGETLISEKNITRRQLVQTQTECKATNPIDRCWRCDPNWARNRKRLADCARGFGHRTTGGRDGPYYVVTDSSDDDVERPRPGTLRHAAIQPGPLWIVFSHSMVIRLKQELIFSSHKTVDGRGAHVHIAYGAGITLQFVRNAIVHNVWIHDIVPTSGGMIRDAVDHVGLRTVSDGDGISVFSSSDIWIDHVSLSKGTDGLIDVIEGSTAVTISNCKFNNHDSVMLLGAHDRDTKDSIMQVTVAFNRFGKGLVQRMPRCRWGFVHIINNDYSKWKMYAIGGSAHPTIISQGNRFKASGDPNTKEVTKRNFATEDVWSKWQWRSEGDKFSNGAYFTESGPQVVHAETPFTKKNFIKFRPGSYAGRLTRYAGALSCRYGELC